jgi:hypothetical protein
MESGNKESSGLLGYIFSFFFGEVRGLLIGGPVLGIVVWLVVFPIVERRNTSRLESDQAPLVSEFEHYKAKNGKYPERLDALVPDYLAELPQCPISHKPGYAFDPKTGDYELFCPTFLFSVRSYTPSTKAWRLSID